jgi:catechol 2,3-dioxygenase-like lactoylglutathione lyase family enzyme
MAVEVIGIDHVYLAVSDMARSEAFYDGVLRDSLGFRKKKGNLAGEPHVHYYNRHFGFSIRPAGRAAPHDPYSPGLHHFCFRVEDHEAVEAAASALRGLGVKVTDPAHYPQYAPDYYAIFFIDPDGVRLEITNFREERRARHTNWEGAGSRSNAR